MAAESKILTHADKVLCKARSRVRAATDAGRSGFWHTRAGASAQQCTRRAYVWQLPAPELPVALSSGAAAPPDISGSIVERPSVDAAFNLLGCRFPDWPRRDCDADSESRLVRVAAWKPRNLAAIVPLGGRAPALNSKFPMFVAWGEELGFLYNDSYAEILGASTRLRSALASTTSGLRSGATFHRLSTPPWRVRRPIERTCRCL
jgi:hypothetical protein